MPGPLALTEECCAPSCTEPVSIQVPGVKGIDGDDGDDGADGIDAATTTTAQFVMPAEGANVSASMVSTAALVAGEPIFVQTAGTMLVVSITNANTAVLQNPENTATGAYAGNAAPATAIPSGSKVTPTGFQGPAGALTGAAGGDLKGTFPNPKILVANIKGHVPVGNGTDTISIAPGADGTVLHSDNAQATGRRQSAIDLTGVLTALSGATPIANGGTGQIAKTAAFNALSPITTRGDIIVGGVAGTNQRLAVGAANTLLISDGTDWAPGKIAPANINMATGPLPRYGLLASLTGANFNSTADQAMVLQTGVTRYIIRRIIVDNASVNLTGSAAAGGIYTQAAKAGTAIVAAAQMYTALTASTKFKDLTLEAVIATDILTATTIYLSLTTPHGVAVTANVWVFGENLTP